MTIPVRFLILFFFSMFAFPVKSASLGSEFFGLHIHRADQGTAWPKINFGSWRLWDAYVTWAQLEPLPGQWDFSKLDRYVAMAELTKVDILLPLANTPQWAAARPDEPSAYRSGNASEPARMADWRSYVKHVGERYKGKIRHYEIWNEPSDAKHFTGTVGDLVKMTCEAHSILKAIDPNIRIVSPASAGGGRHVDYLDKFLAAGGSKCIDIVAHHLYVYQRGPEAMIPLIRNVRAVMKKNNVDSLPLWNTETGWWLANAAGSSDHAMVANGGWRKYSGGMASDIPLRAFLLARSEGVERFYWYSWDNQYGLGMIESTSKAEKPIVEGWRDATSKLLGARDVKCTSSLAKWRCVVTNSNGSTTDYQWID